MREAAAENALDTIDAAFAHRLAYHPTWPLPPDTASFGPKFALLVDGLALL